MPSNTGEVVRRYRRVLIPEVNSGQLALLIRAAHLVDVKAYSKVQGQPIFAEDLENEILRVAGDLEG
jgi:2-oxoglutarate ferredoxin oxidoreductase subunit alpha